MIKIAKVQIASGEFRLGNLVNIRIQETSKDICAKYSCPKLDTVDDMNSDLR